MPHFRKGYDERLDLTEAEYLAQLMDNADELDDTIINVVLVPVDGPNKVPCPEPDTWCETGTCWYCDGMPEPPEGEPYEGTYLPGIADYDRFNRPSWEVPE